MTKNSVFVFLKVAQQLLHEILSRTVSRLQYWVKTVSDDHILSGDLVLFAQSDVVTHAGIYVGGGHFFHAPTTGGEVSVDQLNSKYWSSQQVTFRPP